MGQDVWHEISTFWKEIFSNIGETPNNISELVQRFPLLKLAEQNRFFFAILRVSDLRLEYHSQNTEDVLGFSAEEFAKKKLNAIYEAIPPEHIKGVLDTIEYAKSYYNTVWESHNIADMSRYNVADVNVYRCGLKFIHRQKGEIRLLWRNQIFDLAEGEYSSLRVIIMMQDITHLMKGDFFWFRAIHKDTEVNNYFVSRSDTEGYSTTDILSDREKEVLKCLIEGKTTEQTAKELFISKVTVNNHRQNMLNKVGAKDVTALLQLAKMTKLI